MRAWGWLFALQALAFASPSASGAMPWRYEARLAENGSEVRVEAWLPAGVDGTFSVEDGCERFLTAVEMEAEGVWKPIERTRDAWYPPVDVPLHLRYRFRLKAAAAALQNSNQVSRRPQPAGAVTMASPAAWILRPWKAGPDTPLRIHCALPPGLSLVTGLETNAAGTTIEDSYDHVDYSPYTAFGPFQVDRFEAAGVAVEVATLPDSLAVSKADLRAWAGESIANLRMVYGAFPEHRLVVMILPSGGQGVVFGSTKGGGGPALSILMSSSATADDLKRDWVLTHECIHLSHPGLPRAQHWFEEGLATYLEPLMRARRNILQPEEVWREFLENLPKGLPRPGDLGLDRTHSWGSTYWGGTLFCLLADLEIRQATGDRKSLDDALKGIVAAGGNHFARWSLEKTLEVGDQAIGGHILRDLHQRMGPHPERIDLKALFTQLGVRLRDREVIFDDTAPLAAIRRSLTR